MCKKVCNGTLRPARWEHPPTTLAFGQVGLMTDVGQESIWCLLLCDEDLMETIGYFQVLVDDRYQELKGV